MRYKSGCGRSVVLNSYISTFPPVCIQAVRVGVGVNGIGVTVLVAVDVVVGMTGVSVEVGAGMVAVSRLLISGETCNSIGGGVTPIDPTGTSPQA